MKGKKCMKKGGAAKKEMDREGLDKEIEGEAKKHGGKVHKAKGEKHKHRLDKPHRARGGRMSPSAPLSGAAPSKQRAGAKMGGHTDKDND